MKKDTITKKRGIMLVVFVVILVVLTAILMSTVSSAGTYGYFTYEDNGDGTVTITEYSGNEASVSVPSQIGGKNVTKIGSKCFQWLSLQSITIPSTVTYIHPWAFRGLAFLSSISVSSSNAAFKVVDGCLYSKDMKSLILTPATISGTFTVPEGVESIYGSCFHERPHVTSVVLPSTLKNIYLFAFRDSQITSITIPASVSFIDEFAFMDSKYLQQITIPEGVQTIYEGTFETCTALSSISIPTSVTEIESGAFKGCTSLSTVNYSGTAAQWGSIAIGTSDNAALLGASIRTAHTVTFKNYNGETLKSQIVKYGGAATAPDVPARDNYTFVGWDKAFDNVTSDIVVTALYTDESNNSLISSTNKTTRAGKTVSFEIVLTNNPGMNYLALDFTYDSNVLTLINIEGTALVGSFTGVPNNDFAAVDGAFTLLWAGASNSAENGTLATLTFTVKDDAPVGAYDVTMAIAECYNQVDDDVEIYSEKFTITVIDYIPGDVNGDGVVNGKDATRLLQHLAHWSVEIDEAAADCNGDGVVNGKDATRLLQHLAHWNVTVG